MIKSNEIAIEMKKWKKKKMKNKTENCLICGKFSTCFKYYNVLSCNSKNYY